MQYKFGRPAAVAKLSGGRAFPLVRGMVYFYQLPAGILVKVDASGLPDNDTGFYGFHIHEGRVCDGVGFSGSGNHYNKSAVPHPRHAGDLPPLLSYHGNAYMTVVTDRFSMVDIIGRTVVIHSKADDFMSQPAGNAGEKIACGVIENKLLQR